MYAMTDRQTEFFTALCAPFPESDLRHHAVRGKTLSYITNRILFIRLDNVAGPDGWYTEYRTNERGFTCRLHIRVPDDSTPGGYRWMFKEDGGGYAGMQEKDNDEKSGYSDAAKRAGMVWGIGRELYKDGLPAYLDEAPASEPSPAPRQQSAPPRQQQQAPPPRQSAPPRGQQAPARGNGGGGGGGQGQGQYDNFRVPKAGKAPFAWLCGLEEHFGNGVKAMANAYAKGQGYPFKSNEWDQEMVDDVAWAVIDDLKGWTNYNGEFDHLEDPRPDPQ